MRTRIPVVARTLVLAAFASCGGSSQVDGGSGTPAVASDVATYRALVRTTESAAGSYRQTMFAASMMPADCAAAHANYDAEVRPWISQMVRMSGEMDAFIDAHDGAGLADMACVANGMMDELDAHGLVACSFARLGDDQAEVSRHVAAMTAYATYADDRCGQMMNGLDHGAYAWGPMMPVCAAHDGAMTRLRSAW